MAVFNSPVEYFWNRTTDSTNEYYSKEIKYEYLNLDGTVAVLSQIPDETYGVEVEYESGSDVWLPMTQLKANVTDIDQGQYKVDWTSGFLFFSGLDKRKNIRVHYFGRGFWLISDKRICVDVTKNPDGSYDYDTLHERIAFILNYKNRGVYDNNTSYELGNQVFYNGSTYIVVEIPGDGRLKGIDPTNTQYWQQLAAGFNHRGKWASGVAYNPYDTVYYKEINADGSPKDIGLYVCIKANTSVQPGQTPAYWYKFFSTADLCDVINQLQKDKADRALITDNQIDTRTSTGIYSVNPQNAQSPKKVTITNPLNNNSLELQIKTLIVYAGTKDNNANECVQLALCSDDNGSNDGNDNRFLIYRTDNPEQWGPWRLVDESLFKMINQQDKDILKMIGTLSSLTTSNKTDLVSAINSEVTARKKADEDMQGIIDEIDSTLDSHISGEMYNHSAGDILYENPEYSDAMGVKQALDELFANKAAKGIVTASTIDQTTEPGIYGAVGEVYVNYFDASALNNTTDDPIRMLLVSNNSDNQAVQTALVDTSRDSYILVTRSKTPSGEWSRWERIDGDALELLKNKADKGIVSKDTIDTTTEPGIYGASGDFYIRFTYEYEESSNRGTSGVALMLLVSNDDTGKVTQSAILDADSTNCYISVYRSKIKDGQWTKWHALAGGLGGSAMTDDLLKYLIGDVKVNYSISNFTVSYYKPDITFDITCDIIVQINGRDYWWDQQVHTVLNNIRINSYSYTKYLYLTENDVIFSDNEIDTTLNVFKRTFCLPLGKLVIEDSTSDGTYLLSKDTDNPLFSQIIANEEVTTDMFTKTTEDLTLIPEAIGDLYAQIGNVATDAGTLKNPITVTYEQLDKTWQPGWYLCDFNNYPEIDGLEIIRGKRLVQVINETFIDDNGVTKYNIFQLLYNSQGVDLVRDTLDYNVTSFEDVLKRNTFSDWEYAKWHNIGSLSQLKTTTQTDLVSAINEVYEKSNDLPTLDETQITRSFEYPSDSFRVPTISSGGTYNVVGNDITWTVSLGNDSLIYPIIIFDPIFGKFKLEAYNKDPKWTGAIPKTEFGDDIRLYLRCNVNHNTKTNTITSTNWETFSVKGGSNVDYIEMSNGNTIKAVCIYCGTLNLKLLYTLEEIIPNGDASIKDYYAQPYMNRAYAGNAELQSEIDALKAEIQELKANFIKNGDSVVIDANDSE